MKLTNINLETVNQYYIDDTLDTCEATVIDVKNNKLYFDRTIFYAESGGQECDTGRVRLKDKDQSIEVIDVQYELTDDKCRTAHIVAEDVDLSAMFKAGDVVELNIDRTRRDKLAAYHTAQHLLYIAADKVRLGLASEVAVSAVRQDNARCDFRTVKFDPDTLTQIESQLNEIINADLPVKTYFVNESTNERVWECDGVKIPCGGIHIKHTGQLNELSVKRKNIGRGKDRVICYRDGDVLR